MQKVPALLDEVQGLFDSAPRRWQFYLTGSSARRLRARSANLLPGRSHAYHLHPRPLLEHWVAQELVARADYSGRGHRVSFWRTTYGVEVDLVWESPREDVPVEVTWTTRPRPVDVRHLETFLYEFPRRAVAACSCAGVPSLSS